MFNPSGKIFGLPCWHLIDSPANTKILMSYKRTKYSDHHLCVLWRGLGGGGDALHSFAGAAEAVVPTWAAGKQVPGVKWSVLLQPKPSSKGQEHCIFPLGWQTCQDAALPKVWGFYFILVMLLEQFLISWFSFRAQDPKMPLEAHNALMCTLNLQKWNHPACCTQPGGWFYSALLCASVQNCPAQLSNLMATIQFAKQK